MFFYCASLIAGTILLAIMVPGITLFRILRPISEQLGGLFLWLFILSSLLVVLIKINYSEVIRESKVVYAFE